MIVARLIGRVEVWTGYKVHTKFWIPSEQYLGQEQS